jgi:hypothetical protein
MFPRERGTKENYVEKLSTKKNEREKESHGDFELVKFKLIDDIDRSNNRPERCREEREKAGRRS